MYTVYLAGPRTPADEPHNWRQDIQESNNLNVLEFEDPSEIEADGKILVEESMQRLKNSDAVLVRAKSGVPSYSAAMAMVYAQAYDTPVVVWHDGQELSSWILYHSNGQPQRGNEALQTVVESL